MSYWKLLDNEYRDALRLIRDSRERDKAARSLRDADRYIKILAPMLRNFIQVPNISVFHETDAWESIKITDLLAAGGLLWVASFVEGWKSEPGRRTETYAIRCAEELAEKFKKQTGNPHWRWIGELIAKNFPSILPKNKDDGGRDLRLWIKNLVKRHSPIRKRRLAENRPGVREAPKEPFFPPEGFPKTFRTGGHAWAHIEGREKQREIIRDLLEAGGDPLGYRIKREEQAAATARAQAKENRSK